MDDSSQGKPPTFWQMLHSILAAAFGVQSGKTAPATSPTARPAISLHWGTVYPGVHCRIDWLGATGHAPYPLAREEAETGNMKTPAGSLPQALWLHHGLE